MAAAHCVRLAKTREANVRHLIRAIFALVFFAGAAHAADAPDCKLVKQVSLAVEEPSAGIITVPVVLDGKPFRFAVDLTAISTLVGTGTAAALQLDTRHGVGGFVVTGNELSQIASVPSFALGGVTIVDSKMFVAPDGMMHDPGVAGILGLDILERFDVELDLAHKTLNLFSPDHCKGQVVYWTGAAVMLPIDMQHLGWFEVPMTLDGAPVTAVLRTNAAPTSMAFAATHRLFDLARTSSGMAVVPDAADGEDVANFTSYRYPFKVLVADGLAIGNPAIRIDDLGDVEHFCDNHVTRYAGMYGVWWGPTYCNGHADLYVGLDELRKLRLFIDFSEKTLYLTGADAH